MDVLRLIDQLINGPTLWDRIEAGLSLLTEGVRWWKEHQSLQDLLPAMVAASRQDLSGLTLDECCNRLKVGAENINTQAGGSPWWLPLVSEIVKKLFDQLFGK